MCFTAYAHFAGKEGLTLKTVLLISDDATFAPKVVTGMLEQKPGCLEAILAVPPTSTHANAWKFTLAFLLALGPVLFIRRVFETLTNRVRTHVFKIPATVPAVSASCGIPYYKFERINSSEARERLKSLKPDVLVSCQPQILSKQVLQIPRIGTLNIHPAKLPAHRGPTPLFWALHDLDREFGLTVHFMNEIVDDGDIVIQKTFPIEATDTYASLSEKVTQAIPGIVVEALEAVKKNKPLRSNDAFDGCYQGYPGVVTAIRMRWRRFLARFKKN